MYSTFIRKGEQVSPMVSKNAKGIQVKLLGNVEGSVELNQNKIHFVYFLIFNFNKSKIIKTFKDEYQ